MKLPVLRLPHARDLALPAYATDGAAGFDLVAAVETEIELLPGARAAIPCGIALGLPDGFEAQVRPRSGLALHHGVTVLNAPGTIDSDYRGEVKAILVNLGNRSFRIARGMKIAQLVIAPLTRAELVERNELPPTSRGQGGFGSTDATATSGA
jgi:dUTP pyrophosphatase